MIKLYILLVAVVFVECFSGNIPEVDRDLFRSSRPRSNAMTGSDTRDRSNAISERPAPPPRQLARQNASPNVRRLARRRRGLTSNQRSAATIFIKSLISHHESTVCHLTDRQNFCAGRLSHNCLGYACTQDGGACAWRLVNQVVSILDTAVSVASLAVPGVQGVRAAAAAARSATTSLGRSLARDQAKRTLKRGIRRVGAEVRRNIRDSLLEETIGFATGSDEYAFVFIIEEISNAMAAERAREDFRGDEVLTEILEYVDIIGVMDLIDSFTSQACYQISPPPPEPNPNGDLIDAKWNACLDYPYKNGSAQENTMFQYGCTSFNNAVFGLYEDYERPVDYMEMCNQTCSAYAGTNYTSCLDGCTWMQCSDNWAMKRGCMHYGDPLFAWARAEWSGDTPVMVQYFDDIGGGPSSRHQNCLDYPWANGASTSSFRTGCNRYVEVDKLVVNPRSVRQRCEDGCSGQTDVEQCRKGCLYMECTDPWALARGCNRNEPRYTSASTAPMVVADPQYDKCMVYPYTSTFILHAFRHGCDAFRSGFTECQATCEVGQGFHADRTNSIVACRRGCDFMRCEPTDTWAIQRGCALSNPTYNPLLNQHDMPLAVGMAARPISTLDVSNSCLGQQWRDVQGGAPNPGPGYYQDFPPAGDPDCGDDGCHGELFKNFYTRCWPNGRKWQRLNWYNWYGSGQQPEDNCNGPDGDMWSLPGSSVGMGFDRIYLRSVPCSACEGSWSEWSTCGDCDTESRPTSRVRYYTITQEATGGGQSCPEADGAMMTMYSCDIWCPTVVRASPDCVGQWGPWDSCPACGSGLTTSRTFNVRIAATGTGVCEAQDGQSQQGPCQIPACPTPIDCVGQWEATSLCDVECGTGQIQRRFRVLTPAQHGGTQCQAQDGDTDSISCLVRPCEQATTTTTTTTPAPEVECRVVGAFKTGHLQNGFTGNFFHAYSSDVSDLAPGSRISIQGEPFEVRYVNTNRIQPGLGPRTDDMQAVYLTTRIRTTGVVSSTDDRANGRVHTGDCWNLLSP